MQQLLGTEVGKNEANRSQDFRECVKYSLPSVVGGSVADDVVVVVVVVVIVVVVVVVVALLSSFDGAKNVACVDSQVKVPLLDTIAVMPSEVHTLFVSLKYLQAACFPSEGGPT